MDKTEKEKFVAEMKGRLERAVATFVVDYQGLDVEAMNSLRGQLKKIGTEFQVVKNRLLRLASRDTDNASLSEHLVGPCALAITYEDAVGPAKVLVDRSKDLKHLEIKVGQIGGKVLDFSAVKRLAELPSREVLLSQVLSAMQAVPASVVRTLNGVIVNLVNVLKAIENQKGEGVNP